MNKKALGWLIAAAITTPSIQAQDINPTVNLSVETRIDYNAEFLDGDVIDANTGFKGRYLNIQMSGDINNHFSYSYRQRLNKAHSDQSFFDATDWLYLSYMPNANWRIAAGKEVVGIGGYEYDRAPINLYRNSEYWYNIACYQMGVSGAYITNSGKDTFTAQVCESPFRDGSSSNLYAYNLMWNGAHNRFNTIYSINAMELPGDAMIYYIALGNKFNFGKASLELDLMNRSVQHQAFFFKDYSIMSELSYEISGAVKVFGKYTRDVNDYDRSGDYCVLPGTKMNNIGAGVEYRPLHINRHDIRFHAFYFYSWGQNGNVDGTLMDKHSVVNVGLTWHMNILKAK